MTENSDNKTNYANQSDSITEKNTFKSSDVQRSSKVRYGGGGYIVEGDVLNSPTDRRIRNIIDEVDVGTYARQLHKTELKQPNAGRDHYQTFLGINFHLDRAIESLNVVGSRLQEHSARLEYDEYLAANLEDYSHTEYNRSETRKFIEAYTRRMRPLVEIIEREVGRYQAIENERINNGNNTTATTRD